VVVGREERERVTDPGWSRLAAGKEAEEGRPVAVVAEDLSPADPTGEDVEVTVGKGLPRHPAHGDSR
jgi:hypothetical protein